PALLCWEEAGNVLARMRSVAGASLLMVLALAACATRAERRPALGEAFVGPLEYDLREALAARSRVAARLRHGERVEIISRRRRFYQIRTQSGAEGWIDGRLLLSGQDLQTLRRLGVTMCFFLQLTKMWLKFCRRLMILFILIQP
ncbi:MAG: SH3 domain-containing protein, partial [Candidatus Margulisiibacteriota bacterium]